MKYTFINENDLFVKADGDGKAIMLIKTSGFQVFLNKTALYILNMSKNYSDTVDLINALYTKFSNVDRRLIQNDLEDLFNVMNIYGIVDFDINGSEINADFPDNYVTIAGDNEYRGLSHFIRSECLRNENCYMQVKSETYYMPISLRYHTFNNSEYYFMVYRKGELSLVIAVNPPNANSTVYSISGIYYPVGIDTETVVKLLKMGIDRICNEYAGRISKIRITLQNDDDDPLKTILQPLQFVKECTLIAENQNGSLSLYAFFV